jgi:hypothetical protein
MARTIHSAKYNSKQLCNYYYSASNNGTEWRCRKCEQLKSKNGGWTNLLSHLKSCVGTNYDVQYAEHAEATRMQQKHSSLVGGGGDASAGTMSSFVLRISDAEKEMAEWISYIVVKNQPISLVDCPATRKLARLKPVGSKSVRKHVLSLMTVVKECIKQRLPSSFALIFDGWTDGTDHYIGIWASYNVTDGTHDGKEHPVQTLLSIRPLLADGIEGMTAHDHLRHITRILDGYGKTSAHVICLVGDNCSVNQSIARTMEVPLIGCASHKFNLAVRRWIKDQPDLTDIIAKVSCIRFAICCIHVAN